MQRRTDLDAQNTPVGAIAAKLAVAILIAIDRNEQLAGARATGTLIASW
jgi:hypothetical protein